MASLTLNPSKNADPFFTTLDDLRTPDAKDLHLCSDAALLYIYMIDFEDCVPILCQKIKKWKFIRTASLFPQRRIFQKVVHGKKLVTFLKSNNYRLEKYWLTDMLTWKRSKEKAMCCITEG
ncbi:unnamed protein product [Bursaphelenchus xylophilus]|uniref:(pine wood nematode) hypothetical protein n=1 Tax=Bursaphelenchus xylophilus TaxID=6326 RepID=A0A7I8XJQ8_BURXY|nr:unnamed protein product [Bursaphelenchus xylophilus]CAG9121145.1 unnamed protein product [Bursaphelenchus xylophilus]